MRLPKRVNTFVVIYDIFSDQKDRWFSSSVKRRGKIARILLEVGIRTQKSVYEINASATELERALKRIEKVAHLEKDKIYVYPMESKVVKNILRVGKEPPTSKLIFI